MIVTNFDEFMEIFYSNIEKDSHRWRLFKKKIEQIDSKLSNIDFSHPLAKEELYDIFSFSEIKSRTSFYTIRKLACEILAYGKFDYRIIKELQKIDDSEVYSECDFQTDFFGDWGEIKSRILAIEELGSRLDLERAILFCGLIWCGFDNTAISCIQAKHINVSNRSLIREKDGKEVALPNDLFLKLKSKARQSGNDYVFKGRSGDKIHVSTITKTFENLNKYVEKTGKRFSTQNILLSGMFSRVYEGKETFNQYDDGLAMKYKGWIEFYRG